MNTLSPCSSCRRHVRLDAPACPFCGGAVDALAVQRPRAAGIKRFGRAAIFLLGAGVGGAGCVAAYGAPPVPDAGAIDAGPDDGDRR